VKQRQLIRGFICLVTIFSAGTTNAQEISRFEAGPVFAYLRIPLSPPINDQNQAEIGGRFSWNVSRQIAVEGEVEASPFRTTNLTTPYQGGHLLQTFVGVKIGKRWDKFGVFGRFRPGFTSYSGVIKEFTTGATEFGRRTDPAFDVGGGFEFFVSRRILLRYDLGDTVIHYNSTSVRISGQAVPAPGVVRNNFQFSTGIAFRF